MTVDDRPAADRAELPVAAPDAPPSSDPRGGPSRWNEASFRVFHAVIGTLTRVAFRVRIENHPRLDGAYVLAGNHTSFLDPLVLGAAMRRRITFMMTSIVYRSPKLGWFYRWMHTIPVTMRGANTTSLREARSSLGRGEVLGIFPEGGISRDGDLLLGSPGAVSLVLSEGVPVVPVGLEGVDFALPFGAAVPRPAKIVVRFGDPIAAADLGTGRSRKQRLQTATVRLMREIARLSGRRAREDVLGFAPDS